MRHIRFCTAISESCLYFRRIKVGWTRVVHRVLQHSRELVQYLQLLDLLEKEDVRHSSIVPANAVFNFIWKWEAD